MLIGELSRYTGLSRDTIRYYERRGLITNGTKAGSTNDYKDYPEQTLRELALVRELKQIGLSLKEIDGFLNMWRNESTCDELSLHLKTKLSHLDEEIRKLEEVRSRLSNCITACRKGLCRLPIKKNK